MLNNLNSLSCQLIKCTHVQTSFLSLIFHFPVLWRSLIVKNNGILNAQIDMSSLAKVTDGYTQKHIMTACQQVLTERRVSQLAKRPLVGSEFVPALARLEPIYKEEEEAFKVGEHFFVSLSVHDGLENAWYRYNESCKCNWLLLAVIIFLIQENINSSHILKCKYKLSIREKFISVFILLPEHTVFCITFD